MTQCHRNGPLHIDPKYQIHNTIYLTPILLKISNTCNSWIMKIFLHDLGTNNFQWKCIWDWVEQFARFPHFRDFKRIWAVVVEKCDLHWHCLQHTQKRQTRSFLLWEEKAQEWGSVGVPIRMCLVISEKVMVGQIQSWEFSDRKVER